MTDRGVVLVQTEPRPWLSLLYAKAIDLVAPGATDVQIVAKGVGTLVTSPALAAVESFSRSLGQDGSAFSSPNTTDALSIFSDAALESRSAKLSSGKTTLFESKNSGFSLELLLTKSQEAELRDWVRDHGDDFDVIFRDTKRVKRKVHPIGVRLKPGQDFFVPGREVPEELRSGVIDLQSVRQDGSTVLIEGRVRRLIPHSGFLGRMGRYDITIQIEKAEEFAIDDDRELRAVPVTVGHFDPAERSLILGMPAAGWVEVITTASEYKISIAEHPAQVRRWKRWITV